jgi:hypothetical protein
VSAEAEERVKVVVAIHRDILPRAVHPSTPAVLLMIAVVLLITMGKKARAITYRFQ